MTRNFILKASRFYSLLLLAVLLLLSDFAAYAAPPTITSITPTTGLPVTGTVTINGSGFNDTASRNVVWFGSVQATVTAASSSSLTVTIPAGARYGSITVMNKTTMEAAMSKELFAPDYNTSCLIPGTNTFKPRLDLAINASTDSDPYHGAIGDVDGDGVPDLVVCTYQDFPTGSGLGYLYIYRSNAGQGKLSFDPPVLVSSVNGATQVRLADLDNDGKLDIIVAATGSGRFGCSRNKSTPGTISIAPIMYNHFGQGCPDIAIADFDGDGKLDIAGSAYTRDSVQIFRNIISSIPANGFSFTSTFTTYYVGFPVGVSPKSLCAGDIDGDGKPDIITSNAVDGTISVLRNISATDTFMFEPHIDFPAGINCGSVRLMDLNGDNKAEIFVTNNGSSDFSIFPNTVTSTPLDGSSFGGAVSVSTGVGSAPVALDFGDMDGDGKTDVVVTMGNGDNAIIFKNAYAGGSINASAFTMGTALSTGGGSGPVGISVGDIDGDTKPDIVTGNITNNTVSIFKNTWTPDTVSITGTDSVCISTGITLTNLHCANENTYWSVTNTNAVIAGGTGPADIHAVVTGMIAGVDTVICATVSLYDTNYVRYIVRVLPIADTGMITGPVNVCAGANITLAETATGGTWSSGNPSFATVTATGVVTGVAAGSTVISYTATSASCGSLSAQHAITVNALPDAGTISGPNGMCIASSISLTESVPGGTWINMYPAFAPSVVSGTTVTLTGLSVGADTLLYVVTTPLCGSDTAIKSVGVIATGVSLSITGTDSVCLNSSATLSNGAAGGTWSTTSPGIISVNSSTGMVTGVGIGTAQVTYTVTYTCGPVVSYHNITVKALPDAGTISGLDSVCNGAAISLTTTGTGGVWSSGATGVATVSATGVVSGASSTLATATISYTASTFSCGSQYTTHNVTVKPLPDAGAITGLDSVCSGAQITLTDAPGNPGAWSSLSSSVATVNASGVVTGVSATLATTTITYTASTFSCGSAFTTHAVTVKPLPNAGTISGLDSVCQGATISLTTTGTGGTWTSGATGVATVSATGVVGGASSTLATTTISYTAATFSCGTQYAMHDVTVKPLPVAGTITGLDSVCSGAQITLADAPGNPGAWSSLSGTVATVNASGVVTGVSASLATTTITYTVPTFSCGSAFTTHAVTVKPLPNAGTISGSDSVCQGATISLTTTGTGGSWTSSATGVATVSATGVVGGASSTLATATISYTAATFSCGTQYAMHDVTVKPLPVAGTITGLDSVCSGAQITLADAPGNPGAWSSLSGTVATVNASGVVTGVSASLATTTITYTVPTFSCGSAFTTQAVTVKPLPNAGTISGSDSVCQGATITLTTTGAGGTWSSASGSIATVTSGGVVGGASATLNTTNILYTATTFSCGSNSASHAVTVKPLPNAGAITGLDSVCSGAIITLSDATGTPGGAWSSLSASIATVNASGAVTGVSASLATTTITYTASTFSCGSAFTTHAVTVKPLPNAGTISGPSNVCYGATVSLNDAAPGGTWSSLSSSIATVSGSGGTGTVGGASSTLASTTISYTVSTFSCGSAYATHPITVNPLPNAGSITGASSVCEGLTTSLADAAGSGTWSSTNTSAATITSGGIVTGVAGGATTISYTVTNTCGTSAATLPFTVNPQPVAGVISGPTTTVCETSTIVFTDPAPGGTWSSLDPLIATVSGGTVGGASAGTTLISYTVSNVCGNAYASIAVTVNPLPHAGTITGAGAVCEGSTTTLADPVTGGVWSSAPTTVATVASDTVYGVSAGSVTIFYTLTNTCGTDIASHSMVVNPLPHAGTISGIPNLCPGTTTALSSTVTGGVWSSSPTTIATVTSTGVAGGVSPGVATISYAYTNVCGTDISTYPVTVIPFPTAGTVSGPSLVCPGTTIFLSSTSPGGTWTSLNTAVATANASSGLVGGVAPGTANIKYTVTNFCGAAFTTHPVTVNPIVVPSVTITLSPNDTVCAGTPVTFTPTPVNGGPSPTYTWTNFGVPIATGNTFTYSPALGDNIACIMVSSAPCPVPPADTTNAISMFVYPVVTPVITIVSTAPGDSIAYLGELVTFYASITYGGSAPTFQWYLNGNAVAGATSSSYTAYIESPDTVFCVMTSNLECITSTLDTSNVKIITIGKLNIGDITAGIDALNVYPNPNNGSFTISGDVTGATGTPVYFQVINMLGEVVYNDAAEPVVNSFKHELHLGQDISPGNYILRIVKDNETRSVRFTIKN